MLHKVVLLALSALAVMTTSQHSNDNLGEPPPKQNDSSVLAADGLKLKRAWHENQNSEGGITLPPVYDGGKIRRAWDHMVSQVLFAHRLGRKTVCYDGFGCFHVSGKFSQFRSVPESPEQLDTKFYLYTRATVPDSAQFASEEARLKAEDEGEILDISTPESLAFTHYDPQRPTKILIHGYNGRGDGPHSRKIRRALLKKEDSNVISVDWANGARGPNYLRAVANAELIARQLSHLIMSMTSLGASAKDIHIIGFSLGAQVAGLTGAALKKRGEKLGRITGLDPASFTFERAGLEADKRLDISDAEFVDVIHTDGSLMWSDGFGLLKPVGHVDFFPNGGQSQPGCDDSYVGALKFQINNHFAARDLNGSGICSHVRSVDLFIESLDPSCSFTAFPCPGLGSFTRDFLHGNCFSCDGGVCGTMGEYAMDSPGRGPLYLVTRTTKPYCGQQLRAVVSVNPETQMSRGSLVLQLQHGASVTSFELSSSRLSAQALDVISGGQDLSAMSAAKPGSVHPERTPVMTAALSFRPRPGPSRLAPHRVILDRVTITSQEGHWWYYCGLNTTLDYSRWQKTVPLIIQLSTKYC